MKKKVVVIAGIVVTMLAIGGVSRVAANQIPENVDLNSEWAKQRMELTRDRAWMVKPEYSIMEGQVDRAAFAWEDDKCTFTSAQKEQLYSIISSWYEEKFEKAKGLKLESFEGIPIASFDTNLVKCDEKEMILVNFTTPAMLEQRYEGDDLNLFKDDMIQALVYNNGDAYEIYQAWYDTQHKYTGVFSSGDLHKK